MRLPGMVALLLALAVLCGACTSVVAGSPTAAGTGPIAGNDVDPSFVRGTDGSAVDRLAATAVVDVQEFWRQSFPSMFGRQWTDLTGGAYSVDTTDQDAKPVPCVTKAADVAGNAFYCPASDAIAWDRSALLPVLQNKFGDTAVVIVLAHELGHAVQHRTGLTHDSQREQPESYPTIVIEAMADCYAGAFLRWTIDGHAPHLRIGHESLDSALGALVTFRDPIGTARSDQAAHGNAFDRVSAFQDGYQQGGKLCSQMTAQNRQFTQHGFTSRDDQASGGNLTLDTMLELITPDLAGYFGGLVTAAGKPWTAPKVTRGAPSCGDKQGPIAFCSAGTEIDVQTDGTLSTLHNQIGDYATGTLMASRYGLAAMAALGRPTDQGTSGHDGLCLAGAYTGTVLSRSQGFGLSPGDLDEAVQVLLGYDYAARDTAGHNAVNPGFERVAVFRLGVLGGAKSCGV
ncbi:neutral zinc metallopeptidase [Solihabitans fulvus]|nr:neutral zinc metallopeptidase [Solihabitans fulvus]